MYKILKRDKSVKMDGSVPTKLKKNFNCTICHSQFVIKDFLLRNSKNPLLLHCGHSVCEPCLLQNLRTSKSIICKLCGSSSPTECPEQISKSFPPNIYIVGSIVILQSAIHENNKKLALLTTDDGNFNYAIKFPSGTSSRAELSTVTCEECSLAAPWYCENCKSNFCELCWSKVHGSAKSLKKHLRVPVSSVGSSRNGLKTCPEHETQYLEFFCNGCSTTVCSHCVILQHQGEGHSPITLKEKNVEILNKMKTAAEEAEKMKKRMMQTLEKLKFTSTSPETPSNKVFSDLETQITRNFSRIHGLLQLEEERLVKKLQEKMSERDSTMKALQTQLEKQMESVEDLLREYESVVSKPRGDLTDLYKQLLEVENMPCYLIPLKSEGSSIKQPTVTFDNKLIDLVQTYCKLEFPLGESFELRSGSNLPQDYAVEPLNVSDSERRPKQLPRTGQESSASDVDTISNCSSRDLSKSDLSLLLTKPPTDANVFQAKKKYSVRVSYIKNPGEFYITLNSQRAKQQAIDRRASQFANSVSKFPETVSKDQLYLVKYNVDKKWYRARVVEVYPSKEAESEEHVLVYYLDYGNNETVPLSRLRPIPPDLAGPPLAVKCKLFDCVPKNGVWCTESTKTMEKILNNYTATMFVMEVHGDCLEVDLSVIYPEGQIGRDIVSVRDALLFLEFSSFVRGPSSPYTPNAFKYLHQCLPSAGEKLDVVVSHVNSASDFYIQRIHEDTSYLYKLTMDLQEYYGENSEKGFIYSPTIGMPCAALFSSDHKWYRAKIVDIPGKKMVTVFYVDYGNRETISWMKVRKLKEIFVKRPPLALNCMLAGILPADDKWNPHTKAFLDKLLSRESCIQVQGRPKSKQKLRVLLYNRVNKNEICVNALFVKMGYAIKSEAKSSLWMLKTLGDDDEEDDKILTEFFAEKPKCEINEEEGSSEGDVPVKRQKYFVERKKNKLSAKKLRELHESEKKNSICNNSCDEEVESEVDEFNNIYKVKVEILSAESPSSVYITFPTLSAEYQNLKSKLQEFYKDSTPPDGKEWKAGDVCIMLDSEKNCCYRASILSVLPENLVQVFQKDIARVATVPTSALRELDPSFTKFATCAVKCHLADVAPPGDQWPSISCEYLAQELENYKEIYMTKKGQIENKSLPVELWVKKVVPKGALEPITKEWITLNRLLVNQGLAIPVKQKLWYMSASNDDYSDGVKDSENNPETSAEMLSDDKETAKDSEAFLPSLTSRWLPPQPIVKSCFVGLPTYVDYNAVIYLFDVEEDEEKLKTITDSLLNEYKNSKPGPEDHIWSPGQLCIARYHLDSAWYRGEILKTNEDMTYDVLFVDYGNVETCEASDLRKRIKMSDVPILTHKCQVHGIIPVSEDGNWAVSVIDILHSLVVDKKCEVNIIKPATDPSEVYTVTLRLLDSDCDVGAYLMEQGLACLSLAFNGDSDESDFEITREIFPQPSECTDDSVIPLYTSINIPENCDGFFVDIIRVKTETEVFANITDDDSLPPSLKRLLKEYENIQVKLAEECSSQPLVKNIIKGQPCCCVNVKDKNWCRAEILDFEFHTNSVFLLLVDCGSNEFYDKSSLYECKSEWLALPKMALKLKLADIKKCNNASKAAYMKALTNCLTKEPVFAEILGKREDFFEVRLLTNRNGPSAYQEMIDNKLMTYV